MKRLQRKAVVLSLIEQLQDKGSWCGETHVQKATYFLQELCRVPLGFEFILYKHGPYSFDLSDELTAMRADEVVELQPRGHYGPSICPSSRSRLLRQQFPKTLRKYAAQVELISKALAGYGVTELERLATAGYVTLEDRSRDPDKMAERIHELKPHISIEEALQALDDERKIQERVNEVVEVN